MLISAPQADGPVRPQRDLGSFARYESLVFKTLGVVGVLSLWEGAVYVGWWNPITVSSPSRVAKAAISYIGSEQFLTDGKTSGIEFLVGFGLALIVGISLGFAIAWFRRLDYVLDPIISFLYASPPWRHGFLETNGIVR